jgi:phosphosulfolactate phosphohydrolase-like enzyme
VTQPLASDPHAQAKYQIRLDWGVAGARAVAQDADVIVWVDVLPPADGDTAPANAPATELPGSGAVIEGGLSTAAAAAQWVLDHQVRLGRRAMVAVIPAGAQRADGGTRFAVEDLLGAGAVIDALQTLGIDYCSPEAAAAASSFVGLRGAVGHLLTASVSGQEYPADARRAEVTPFGVLNARAEVLVHRPFSAAE